MVMQMRLTESDLAALVELEAWYPGLTRAALMRLALVELQRFVRVARRKHEAEAQPRAVAPRSPKLRKIGVDKLGREWLDEMDEIKQERMLQDLPVLPYEQLLAAGKARRAGGAVAERQSRKAAAPEDRAAEAQRRERMIQELVSGGAVRAEGE